MVDVKCLTAGALAISILLQSLAVFMACKSADFMETEWSIIYHNTIGNTEGHIVKSIPFWGPIKAFLLSNCDAVQTLDAKVEKFIQDNHLETQYGCFAKDVHDQSWWLAGHNHSALQLSEEHGTTEQELVGHNRTALEPHEEHGTAGQGQLRGNATVISRKSWWCSGGPGLLCKNDSQEERSPGDAEPSNPSSASRRQSERSFTETVEAIEKDVLDDLVPRFGPPTVSVPLPCSEGEQLVFGRLGWWDRYLSMITLTRTAADLARTNGDLADSRKIEFETMKWYLSILLVIKYAAKILDVLQNIFGFEVGLARRSKFDRYLEDLVLHLSSSVFCTALQTTLCTCFIIIWRRKHAVVSYVPMFGFDAYFWLFIILAVGNEIDKRIKCAERLCTPGRNVVFWMAWSLLHIVLVVPMIATIAFNVNFLLNTSRCRWVDEDAEIISVEFMDAAWWSRFACQCFIYQAIFEQAVFCVFGVFDAKRATIPEAPDPVKPRLFYNPLVGHD